MGHGSDLGRRLSFDKQSLGWLIGLLKIRPRLKIGRSEKFYSLNAKPYPSRTFSRWAFVLLLLTKALERATVYRFPNIG